MNISKSFISLGPRFNGIKLFFFVTDAQKNRLECSSHGNLFRAGLIFTNKAKSQPEWSTFQVRLGLSKLCSARLGQPLLCCAYSKGRLLALLANVRLA